MVSTVNVYYAGFFGFRSLTNCWFGLQICRVEDVVVEGIMRGSIIHFHWVRTVKVHSSGVISASGLGMWLSSLLCRRIYLIDQSTRRFKFWILLS